MEKGVTRDGLRASAGKLWPPVRSHNHPNHPKELNLKAMFFTAIIGLAGALAACGSGDKPSIINATSLAEPFRGQDAKSTVAAFAKAGLPISNVAVVTSENDSNQLLGRPNQYTSKVFFYDIRHPKPASGEEGENSIEVFSTIEDATRRRDYVAEVTKAMPMLTQYQYLQGRTLVRLHKALTPAEAAQYKVALANLPEA